MYKELDYTTVSKDALNQLAKGGVFLNTCFDGVVNTMTIGWGTLGVMWSKPVFTVAVRYSRHTYHLIENANEFTVSVPKLGHLSKELIVCGTKSGKNIDKFEECNFTKGESFEVNTPHIGECATHFECKVIYKQAMEPGLILDRVKDSFYKANNDFHVVYYGEILRCYTKDE